MVQDTMSDQEQDDPDAEFVEIDPTGRYGLIYVHEAFVESLIKLWEFRYRAFDELEGIEVAWNQVKITDLLRNSEDLERLYSEVHLLKTLKHKNIIKFYNSWVDTKNEHINFITEIFTSGTLRQYRKKHKHVDLRALKKWSRQILEGLLYLHGHDPPVIHRDLKCDNIFVNGNQGEVKIGDLGLAAILRQARAAHSVIGTPEFMAPELYEEEYNELVDVYAFGMCLLELVTFEYPYVECANAAQIFKKVTSVPGKCRFPQSTGLSFSKKEVQSRVYKQRSCTISSSLSRDHLLSDKSSRAEGLYQYVFGIKPASLAKVTDPGVKLFIEKCIAKASERLSAKELLRDPFLQPVEENDSVGRSLRLNPKTSDSTTEDLQSETSLDVRVQGQTKDINTIFLKLRIADSTGQVRNIHFPFDIEADTAIAVASEMVEELDLTDQDVLTIATMIESKIQSHIPDWISRESPSNSIGEIAYSDISESKGDGSLMAHEPTSSPGRLSLERLPSGRRYWSNSPIAAGGFSLSRFGFSNVRSPDNWAEHYEQSHDCYEGGANINRGTSLDRVANEVTHHSGRGDDDGLGKDENRPADMQSSVSGKNNLHDNNGTHSSKENCKQLKDTESEVKVITENLESLLVKQQLELDELKNKHQLTISDLLNELPPEILEKVLATCKLKIPKYDIQDATNH
ncbi:hypothetical protein Goari_026921 [Gossypium aridum]|uniref:non-specific serine/threonine protein kinase n=1 Tax=Gossypium aridum TaxID=34290 RepID=A0A7J8YTT6_GOSAI|nr:hypothetical protein [Gossypium aridum]